MTWTFDGTTSFAINFLAGLVLSIVRGPGAGTQRVITANTNAAPSVVTMEGSAWPGTAPTTASVFTIEPNWPNKPRYVSLRALPIPGGILRISTRVGGTGVATGTYFRVENNSAWELFSDYTGDLQYLEVASDTANAVITMEWY